MLVWVWDLILIIVICDLVNPSRWYTYINLPIRFFSIRADIRTVIGATRTPSRRCSTWDRTWHSIRYSLDQTWVTIFQLFYPHFTLTFTLTFTLILPSEPPFYPHVTRFWNMVILTSGSFSTMVSGRAGACWIALVNALPHAFPDFVAGRFFLWSSSTSITKTSP